MGVAASQITSLTIVYSAVYSGTDHRNLQSSASLAFVTGIHRAPVNSPHKGPVTRKIIPFEDIIMRICQQYRIIISTWVPSYIQMLYSLKKKQKSYSTTTSQLKAQLEYNIA